MIAQSIFDKKENEIDLELFLKDPFLAEKYKRKIQKLNKMLFISQLGQILINHFLTHLKLREM